MINYKAPVQRGFGFLQGASSWPARLIRRCGLCSELQFRSFGSGRDLMPGIRDVGVWCALWWVYDCWMEVM